MGAGWVTGITAQKMAPTAADNSVVNRLEMICVEKYNQDPEKDQKRKIMMEQNAWERGEYIREQGWATMPGENITDRNTSRKCAGIIAKLGQNTSFVPSLLRTRSYRIPPISHQKEVLGSPCRGMSAAGGGLADNSHRPLEASGCGYVRKH